MTRSARKSARQGRLAPLRHVIGVARIERVRRLLCGVGDVTQHMDTDPELLCGVAMLLPGFSIQVNQRAKSPRFATDNGDHQRESQRAGAHE